MSLAVGLVSLCLLAAPPARAFGPVGSHKHPVVGPVAAVPGDGPVPVVPPAVEEVALEQTRPSSALRARGGSNPLYLLFLVYKNHLTKVDGNRCQHYPTCSAYGAQAVGRHNVVGVFMGMDRLWTGGNSSSVRAHRLVYGIGPTPRFYDPVEDSTFWFSYPLSTWLGPSIPALDKALGRDNEPSDDAEAPRTAR